MTFLVAVLFLIYCIAAITFAFSVKSLHINMEMWQFWTILVSYVITVVSCVFIGKEVNKNEQ